MSKEADRSSMIIDGKRVSGTSGQAVEVVNPSTEDIVGRIPVASEEEIDRAAQACRRAFETWRDTPAVERAAAMLDFAQAVRENADEIAPVLTREQGKPLPQAKGEIAGFCSLLEFYAHQARRLSGSVLQSDHRDRFVYVLRQPVGVVAAIPPWNDPLNLLARMIAPALAAGCTVVAKPSSATPLSTIRVAEVALSTALPPGVLNVITGPGELVGERLIHHPAVRKIALTGGLEAGRQVMAAASEEIKRVTLELGGQSPCIVWSDADMAKAAQAITFQGFRGTGQVCNRVNRVYVHADVHDDLVERLAVYAARIKVGDGFEEGVDIGPLNNERQLRWVDGQVQDAVVKGARVLVGGNRIGNRGYFYPPTILDDCTSDMDVMVEETFGPVIAVARVDGDLESALRAANQTKYGLSAFFFSRDMRACYLAAQHLEAGSIWINDIHGSMLQAPYGGMKESGIGREQGVVAIDEYLDSKTIYHDFAATPRGPRPCVHEG